LGKGEDYPRAKRESKIQQGEGTAKGKRAGEKREKSPTTPAFREAPAIGGGSRPEGEKPKRRAQTRPGEMLPSTGALNKTRETFARKGLEETDG